MTINDIIELFSLGACHVPEHTAREIVKTLPEVEDDLSLLLDIGLEDADGN